ncbi:MAG: site-specific DNA-methyltransferase [Bacteroidota bacterium]
MESATQIDLQSRVLETRNVNWRQFEFIQQDDFKSWSPEAKAKLKASILNNKFAQPFYVWHDPLSGVMYCLDGKHRSLILEELQQDGHKIPILLPATFIQCNDKNEAAHLVLVYSSIYAKITQQGLFDFIQLYDIEYDSIREQMDLPSFSSDRFEQKFDMYQVEDAEEPEAEVPAVPVVQLGDIFEINGHRILCGSFRIPENVQLLMAGLKARIVNCDPPYNIPVSLFVHKDNGHADFAMAHGEMSDEEFVLFLADAMKASLAATVPGAIHYYFMDWRHVWHMTEAGRRVYGNACPKQMCVWNKDMMANGSFYRAKHELCFAFSDEQAKALWNKDMIDHGGFYKDNNELVFIFKAGDDDVKHLSHLELKDRIRTNVWNYPSGNSASNPDRYELKNHPTPKPVQMIADAILDTTNPGDIVIDWFLGSGTCLIACEQTGRRCFATELEPGYVEADIIRYINFCHKKSIPITFTHVNGKLKLEDFINGKESINN